MRSQAYIIRQACHISQVGSLTQGIFQQLQHQVHGSCGPGAIIHGSGGEVEVCGNLGSLKLRIQLVPQPQTRLIANQGRWRDHCAVSSL